jgi:hypothetical protein
MTRKFGWFICALALSVASATAQAQQIRIESGTYGANCGAK